MSADFKLNQPIVCYRYAASPYATKLEHILLLKNIAHHKVDVAPSWPRPEIQSLGIGYRRIPILAIGNDVYCDTNLIASVLERRFPPSEGHATLFPPNKHSGKADVGFIKAFSQHYVDLALFPPASGLLPWNKFPAQFIKDRGDYLGTDISVERVIHAQPFMISTMSAHLAILEEQLADGREWLLDTTHLSLADISLFFIFSWIRVFRASKGLFDPVIFPKTLQWMTRMDRIFYDGRNPISAPFTVIDGGQATTLITSSISRPDIEFNEIEATRLGLKIGSVVSVIPADSGRSHATVGRIIGLNREEVVVEVEGASRGPVRCHFPRLGYSVQDASGRSML